jgi:hypothetical protein
MSQPRHHGDHVSKIDARLHVTGPTGTDMGCGVIPYAMLFDGTTVTGEW